jgi:uncharacterized coiled-coil DUF342 family protein
MPPKAADAKAKAKADAKRPKRERTDEEGEDSNRVPPPDKAAFDEKIAKIQEAIDGYQKKQQQLAEKIKERSGGKEEFFAKKAELRAQLDEFAQKINALQAKKEEINKAMGDKREEGRAMKDNLNKMKKSIGYASEADIDARIHHIEYTLMTDSLPLKEEKKLMAEIQELKRNRPKVSQVSKMEQSIASLDPGLSMKEQLQEINTNVRTWLEAKKKVSEKMTELTEARKEQLGDMSGIIEERDKISGLIQEKIKERNAIRDEFRQKEREHYAYLAEQRKARAERAAQEREERQKEYDQRRKVREAEKLDEQPHVAEMTLIEQTIAFCNSLTATKEKEEKVEAKEMNFDAPDGAVVLGKKEDRDEFFFAPTKAKKSKSKAKGQEGGKAKPIKHNAETFKLFDSLKLDAPITLDDIPAVLEKLEAQMEMYKEKVKEWEKSKDEMKQAILEGKEEESKEEAKEEAKEE